MIVAGRNGHGVPIIGAEKSFDVQCHDSPMAYPTSQLIPHSGGATLQIFGGLSKFEHFVGQALSNPNLTENKLPNELIDYVQGVCDALEESRKEPGE